jgi:hypothetical protein
MVEGGDKMVDTSNYLKKPTKWKGELENPTKGKSSDAFEKLPKDSFLRKIKNPLK